ncbi:MAG TPA: transketolase [Patescibacteria group bacterium]|nr:transketolase [Patescibacteria group bacterium]
MLNNLKKIAQSIRYHILTSTTTAGSGHPTSSLSAVELMTVLLFDGFFRYDIHNQKNPHNDRLIFSKGHASPLFYALWAVAGAIHSEELNSLRQFGSRLEGHPTMEFPYTEVPTGSLGQGLSVGVGMALNAKYLDKLPYRTYVLLGDSEMAEGSCWEAIQLASYYKLDNLIGILDVNRLGQRGETMYGHDVDAYKKRIASFGWKTFSIDGHSISQIINAYKEALKTNRKPVMIIAKTLKGKGISFLEDVNGWHGKPLKKDQLQKALIELGVVDVSINGIIKKPSKTKSNRKSKTTLNTKIQKPYYEQNVIIATRKAYGNALVRIFPQYPTLIVLDAETSNSTYADIFQKKYPQYFFEMFIAEQNMVGIALGLSARGKIPFISTFAAFLTRAFDQIRMAQYSDANIKFVGSHCGVSIGVDGASQMGLEDIAMFGSLLKSVILYPSDAYATERIIEKAVQYCGIVYIRITREEIPLLYGPSEKFPIGGSKTICSSDKDVITVIGAGITVHESLKACHELKKENIYIRVIDCYSIKPIDKKTILKAVKETSALITVEDHYPHGGLGTCVVQALSETKNNIPLYIMAVNKLPKSGKPYELLDYEEISSQAIVKKVKKIIAEYKMS